MSWFVIAIMSAAIMAGVNILDSHLITKRLPSVWAYLLFLSFFYTAYGWLILIIQPFPPAVPPFAMLMALVAAILRGLGIGATLYAMASEEVSRVIPISNIYPIFVAISAVPILGETINYMDWAAIILTVAGAVLISIRRSPTGQLAKLRTSFVILLAASFLMGLGTTASKYAMEYISFWNMYSINALTMAFLFLAASLRPSVLRELKNIKQPKTTLTLITITETVAPISIIMGFFALQLGPASLAATVIGTRPLFVFLFALALSHTFPTVLNEQFTRGTMALKLISILMIIAGAAMINLS